ncbi:MAG: FAD binding domain-containing protein [Rhodoferax sp.]
MQTPQMTGRTGAYLRPQTIAQALASLAQSPWTVLAGGTDFYASRGAQPITEPILDISAIADLQVLRDEGALWRVGATVTWSRIVRAELPAQFRALQSAAREIGGVQVQNSGTLGGNICNASPAADGIPVLLALDARVELASLAGTRTMALDEFVLGPRRTARLAGELLTAILVPRREAARSSFIKLGHRRYLVISIAMVSAVFELDAAGVVTYAGIAVGSCSAVAQRLLTLEARLLGKPAGPGLSQWVQPEDLAALRPIDDVRGTGAYRLDVALTLVRRAIEEAFHE